VPGVRVLKNPVLQGILTRLRDRRTGYTEFRRLLYRAGVHVGYELSPHVPAREVEVETPLGARARGVELLTERAAVVAVLRAALPYAWGIAETLEGAKLGVVAAKRREDAGRVWAEVHYLGLPSDSQLVVLADPMLATGSTLAAVIGRLKAEYGYKELVVATIISTPIGVERVLEAEPAATIYALAVDEELDERAFIVPGLGDAGDRAFG